MKAAALAQSVPQRSLGRGGPMVSCIGLGGSHIGDPKVSTASAIAIMRAAIDHGLTFMDSSWDYHDGESERRLGQALRNGYRPKAFVMTKVDGRSKKEATRQLNESLKRLKIDEIDLLQHHEVIRFDDADRIFAAGGAMEALLEAQKTGKARYLGFTGHKHPDVHLYMLELAKRNGVRFDAVQMPLNILDARYRSFESHVLPELIKQGIGVLGMKSMGSGVILKSKKVTAVECLNYSLSLPTSVVITGIDSQRILRQALDVAHNFRPLSKHAMEELRRKGASAGENGEFELFKTTTIFDSTVKHPKWLGEELPRTIRLAR